MFECSKYGKVINCMVLTINSGNTEDSKIRVFVEFLDKEASENAYLDLGTRFFGEKLIQVDFYNENLYYSK
jgi:hypothetical protein